MTLPRFDLRKLSVTAAWLTTGGLTIRLAAVGRGYVSAETRIDVEPGPGTITIEVDNREYHRQVQIVKAATKADRLIDVKDVD